MYNIFQNDFFDSKPIPKWAFTAEFMLSDSIEISEEEIERTPSETLNKIVDVLTYSRKDPKLRWMELLSKSVSKFPIVSPSSAENIPVYFPGYFNTYTGRYDNSGKLTVTFNDNCKREIRQIIEQLLHAAGMNYENDEKALPIIPSENRFNVLVRVYNPELVNQYSPSDGQDDVAIRGTEKIFYYEECFFSRIGAEKNSNEGDEAIRTIDADLVYQRMLPIDSEKLL
jgi:hypothetical protein